jgi:hypothetical protein
MTTLEERVASMPTLTRTHLAVACVFALLATLAAVTAATAATIPADLRVITTSGKVLADQRQYTGTTHVPTSPKAQCFGRGTGGSGRPARLSGSTALGLVADAAQSDRDLRPLSITDHFDFGLGVCGIGGFVARNPKSWYLKVDHKNPQVGGDNVHLHAGDDVLWYLAPAFPYPVELSLVAPVRVETPGNYTVRVFAFSDDGRRTPVAGARVTGADLPTGADGTTTVHLSGPTSLVARHGDDIPDQAAVCVGAGCAQRPALAITGTARRDRIEGTGGENLVRARAGNDRVDVRGGGHDRVLCGKGRDIAILGREDSAAGCEVRHQA